LVYEPKALMVFCVVMPPRRTLRCTAQRRWLLPHPEMRTVFGLDDVPARP